MLKFNILILKLLLWKLLLTVCFKEQRDESCGCVSVGSSCKARVTTQHSCSHDICPDLAVHEKAEVGGASHVFILNLKCKYVSSIVLILCNPQLHLKILLNTFWVVMYFIHWPVIEHLSLCWSSPCPGLFVCLEERIINIPKHYLSTVYMLRQVGRGKL